MAPIGYDRTVDPGGVQGAFGVTRAAKLSHSR